MTRTALNVWDVLVQRRGLGLLGHLVELRARVGQEGHGDDKPVHAAARYSVLSAQVARAYALWCSPIFFGG